jgi:predicted Rossmann fold nucleotide-binding protein DprA/Smf involved in DNA uptake
VSTSLLSAGTNDLLRLDATPLTSPADVLESLGIAANPPRKPDIGPAAAALLERLPAGADELVRASGLTAAEVAAALAELELMRLAAEGDGIYRAMT